MFFAKAQIHYYLKTLIFSLAVFVSVCMYYLLTEIGFGLEMINKSLSTTAVFMMGLSFAMSGIAYFWDFADKKISYRKYLGLIGYYYIFWHAVVSLYYYFLADTTLGKFDVFNNWSFTFFEVNNIFAFVSGLVAFGIFTFMALISNKYAMRFLGKRWRPILRIGYIAIFLGMIHVAIKSFPVWVLWITGGMGLLPPMSLLTVVFISSVILLRIVMGFGLEEKRGK